MKIVIKTTNIELTQSLKDFVEEKLNSLEKFARIFQQKIHFDHFFGRGKPRTEAWVELGKTTFHHKKGSIFWAECQMRFPKKSLRAEVQSESLRQAITEVKDELQRQLKQSKEKTLALTKRKARVLKKELKTSPQARFYRKGRIREGGI